MERSGERGFSLIEVTIATGVLVVLAAGAIAASTNVAGIAASASGRDTTLADVRNAIVEARAAAAYDEDAAAAILGGPQRAWTLTDGAKMQSAVDGSALVFTATAAAQTIRMRYPVVREAVPQGAILDTQGRVLTP